MAEGARLESVYTLIAYRGFESLSLRQNKETGYMPVFLLSVQQQNILRMYQLSVKSILRYILPFHSDIFA